ncbi:hypothetical protein M409DRAFT_26331 [Zasmidium cellare ATCC 36951]|uniref:Uncharacterized protein n=1 Tax=Zasmidium cellare ATCC 36951 TaxID=1080233 RepID=A0A6A6CAP1_ZASCE|nr:uncharacterized protein M409DRAFT_26331 [Zasmidium cellare ATCC 36951]KAF2163290.1 hypothetical protein M409DRAFT_26331 [Zasmidium cellare ATCC 36951]
MAKKISKPVKPVKPVSKPRIDSRREYRTVDNEQESEGSRRSKLIQERDEELWLNKRFTSKGNVVGWYLAPAAQEPFWRSRKIRAKGSTVKPTVTNKQRQIYEEVKLARIRNDPYITQGQMASCVQLFEKPGPTPQELFEAAKRREQASAELAKILDTLKQVPAQQSEHANEEESAAPKDDDAAAKKYAAAQVIRKEMREEGKHGGSLWQPAGQDQYYM